VSWALGAVLAGLAGILLAPLVTLDIVLLSCWSINGYAAAMVGRLRSLPLTSSVAGARFGGGLRRWRAAVGSGEPGQPALPIIFLYVVLLVRPQNRLRAGRVVQARRPRACRHPSSHRLGMGRLPGRGRGGRPRAVTADLTLAGQGVVYA